MQGYLERCRDATFDLELVKVLNSLARGLYLCELSVDFSGIYTRFHLHTFVANVRIAAITSRLPLSTRLSTSIGSYSQMALLVSMAAIFVM
jgi:hypothetical protein